MRRYQSQCCYNSFTPLRFWNSFLFHYIVLGFFFPFPNSVVIFTNPKNLLNRAFCLSIYLFRQKENGRVLPSLHTHTLVIISFKNRAQVALCANMPEKHGLFFPSSFFSLSQASTAYFISCPSPVLFFCSWQCLYIKSANKMQLHLTKKCLKNVTLLSAFLLHSPSAPSSWLHFTVAVTRLTPFSCLLGKI